ncbi:MAG: hypothetical protein ACI97A_001609 [Planctomycetota bacterium]|jgi:hypothetical protein
MKVINETMRHMIKVTLCLLVLMCITSPSMAQGDAPSSQDQAIGKLPLRSIYDIHGQRYNLRKILGLKGIVLAWTSEGCPMSKIYSPRLVEIAKIFEGRGVRFFVIDSSPQDSAEFLKTWGETHQATTALVWDEDARIAKQLHVTRTTEVLVYDAAFKLRYRGAIDDQYGFERSADPETGKVGTYRKKAPTQNYLKDALTVIVDGKTKQLANTDPWGCAIGTWPKSSRSTAGAPTYYGKVQRILENNCNECHHQGGSAPFELQSYRKASGWSDTILEVIDSGAMPPWNANPKHGEFSNARLLAAEDKATLKEWVKAGCPEGNPKDGSKPKVYTDVWQIGQPDMILEAPEFEVPAEGLLTYQYYLVEKTFEKDTWIKAAEVKSTNPEVVHHVLMFLSRSRRAAKGAYRPYRPRVRFMDLVQGAKKGEAQFFFGKARQAQMSNGKNLESVELQKAKSAGYRHNVFTSRENGLVGYLLSSLPGLNSRQYPENRGKFIPAGSKIVFQFHFTPNGRATKTSTKLGLQFWKERPKEVVNTHSLATLALRIPPGEPNYTRRVEFKIPRKGVLLSLHPHMHYRGKSFRYELKHPDGRTEVLLDVPHYDFDWQHEYTLAEPKILQPGSVLIGTAVYDNSSKNPYNPDPNKEVYFGLQSTEEMYVGYFSIVWDESKTKGPKN